MNYMQVLSMPTKEGHSPEWHARRKKGIGGSDSAAVLGVSRWRTPYRVWEEKTGRAEPEPENEAMKNGVMAEPAIRQRYSNETGRIVYDPGFAIDKEYPFIVGDVDGLCDDRILECKNSSLDWEEIPIDYFFQVQQYMRLFQKPLADIAVWHSGRNFQIYTVEAQPELWETIIPVYQEFWKCVETDTPPELETLADVNSAYKNSRESSVILDATAIDGLMRIKNLKATIANLQEQLNQYEFEVKNQLGENAIGTDENGKTLVTWRSNKSRSVFDYKAFQADNPELYERYLRTGAGSRTFLVK